MPIKLYYFSSPTSKAVLMCVKQLSLEVTLIDIDLKTGAHLTPEYTKLNPAQVVPTLVDNDLVLWESRAILRYLANAYAPNSALYPSEPKRRAIVDKLLDYEMSFHASTRDAFVYKVIRGIEPTDRQIEVAKKDLKLMDTLLGDSKFVAGDELTIADFSVLASLESVAGFAKHELMGYQNICKYLENMKKELSYYKEVFD